MTSEIDNGNAAASAYNASEKQKGASKTSRIPIKIIPIAETERLKKPDWIRVKAATASSTVKPLDAPMRAAPGVDHALMTGIFVRQDK